MATVLPTAEVCGPLTPFIFHPPSLSCMTDTSREEGDFHSSSGQKGAER